MPLDIALRWYESHDLEGATDALTDPDDMERSEGFDMDDYDIGGES